MSGPYKVDLGETFGHMQAKRGDKCGNPHTETRFTSPCCYEDFQGKRDTCPKCGAPIVCTVEYFPEATCRIADADEEDPE